MSPNNDASERALCSGESPNTVGRARNLQDHHKGEKNGRPAPKKGELKK